MKHSLVIFSLLAVFLFTACPGKPSNTRMADPDGARERAAQSHQEMDRETK